jgi:hypothetical protein
MESDYLEQSREATKEAIRFDNEESEASQNNDYDTARHCLEQSKHYRIKSKQLLRESEK